MSALPHTNWINGTDGDYWATLDEDEPTSYSSASSIRAVATTPIPPDPRELVASGDGAVWHAAAHGTPTPPEPLPPSAAAGESRTPPPVRRRPSCIQIGGRRSPICGCQSSICVEARPLDRPPPLPPVSQIFDLCCRWHRSEFIACLPPFMLSSFIRSDTICLPPFEDLNCDWPLSGDPAMWGRAEALGILPYNEDNGRGISLCPQYFFLLN